MPDEINKNESIMLKNKKNNYTERRQNGINIESIISYLDKTLSDQKNEIIGLISIHTEMTERRIDTLTKSGDLKHNEMEQDIKGIKDQLNEIFNKTNNIYSAFILKENGEPDFSGHSIYHINVNNLLRWKKKLRDGVLMKIIEWASVGIIAYILLSLFTTFKSTLLS